MRPKLFLIPTIISEGTQDKVIPAHIKSELPTIQHFLVENVRSARRYLSSLKIYESIDILDFQILDKETPESELSKLFQPLNNGKNLGIISESGCPGVADPGARAVRYAHNHKIKVVPLVGPSSILLALMASGLNGQQFAFHGYLPIESRDRTKAIRNYEMESSQKGQTQIFIETPYRNAALFNSLLKTLRPDTELCVALDLTGPNEHILTLPLKQWKAKTIEWPKHPAIFLFQAH